MHSGLIIAKYRFELRAVEPIELPPYAGSAFRGGFGHAFRQVVCVTRFAECEGCCLLERCPYPYVFETPRPRESLVMTKANAVPHPFVLEPPLGVRHLAPGEKFTFNLILVGRGIEYFPYLLFATEELGRRGLGRGRGRYRVEEVHAVGLREEALIYSGRLRRILSPGLPLSLADLGGREGAGAERVEVQFVTPTRILAHGSLTGRLEFPTLFNALRRRLELLAAFHGNGMPEKDGTKLVQAAAEVGIESADLRWWDWDRYSGRQQAWMKLGGVVGIVRYRGDLAPFLPHLKAGECLHVGNGTSFGLGEMRLGPLTPPAAEKRGD